MTARDCMNKESIDELLNRVKQIQQLLPYPDSSSSDEEDGMEDGGDEQRTDLQNISCASGGSQMNHSRNIQLEPTPVANELSIRQQPAPLNNMSEVVELLEQVTYVRVALDRLFWERCPSFITNEAASKTKSPREKGILSLEYQFPYGNSSSQTLRKKVSVVAKTSLPSVVHFNHRRVALVKMTPDIIRQWSEKNLNIILFYKLTEMYGKLTVKKIGRISLPLRDLLSVPFAIENRLLIMDGIGEWSGAKARLQASFQLGSRESGFTERLAQLRQQEGRSSNGFENQHRDELSRYVLNTDPDDIVDNIHSSMSNGAGPDDGSYRRMYSASTSMPADRQYSPPSRLVNKTVNNPHMIPRLGLEYYDGTRVPRPAQQNADFRVNSLSQISIGKESTKGQQQKLTVSPRVPPASSNNIIGKYRMASRQQNQSTSGTTGDDIYAEIDLTASSPARPSANGPNVVDACQDESQRTPPRRRRNYDDSVFITPKSTASGHAVVTASKKKDGAEQQQAEGEEGSGMSVGSGEPSRAATNVGLVPPEAIKDLGTPSLNRNQMLPEDDLVHDDSHHHREHRLNTSINHALNSTFTYGEEDDQNPNEKNPDSAAEGVTGGDKSKRKERRSLSAGSPGCNFTSDDPTPVVEEDYWLNITVHAAQNLPRVKNSKGEGVAPNTFVSYRTDDKDVIKSPIVPASTNPLWNWSSRTLISKMRKSLVVKLWHNCSEKGDRVLGFLSIDLDHTKKRQQQRLRLARDSSEATSTTGLYDLVDLSQASLGIIKITLAGDQIASNPDNFENEAEQIIDDGNVAEKQQGSAVKNTAQPNPIADSSVADTSRQADNFGPQLASSQFNLAATGNHNHPQPVHIAENVVNRSNLLSTFETNQSSATKGQRTNEQPPLDGNLMEGVGHSNRQHQMMHDVETNTSFAANTSHHHCQPARNPAPMVDPYLENASSDFLKRKLRTNLDELDQLLSLLISDRGETQRSTSTTNIHIYHHQTPADIIPTPRTTNIAADEVMNESDLGFGRQQECNFTEEHAAQQPIINPNNDNHQSVTALTIAQPNQPQHDDSSVISNRSDGPPATTMTSAAVHPPKPSAIPLPSSTFLHRQQRSPADQCNPTVPTPALVTFVSSASSVATDMMAGSEEGHVEDCGQPEASHPPVHNNLRQKSLGAEEPSASAGQTNSYQTRFLEGDEGNYRQNNNNLRSSLDRMIDEEPNENNIVDNSCYNFGNTAQTRDGRRSASQTLGGHDPCDSFQL